LRSDAARNRERILVAAREAFAERGLEVGTDDIARRAGVGKGTLYRRFPTKQALVDAIFDDTVARYEALASEVASVHDPLGALREFLMRAARIHLNNHAFFEAAISQLGSDAISRECRERSLRACAQPLLRAQEAGAVNPELEPMDVAKMVKMLAVASAPHADEPPPRGALERYTALLLEGARSGALP
jgi:AcrR family transcriptional regulator